MRTELAASRTHVELCLLRAAVRLFAACVPRCRAYDQRIPCCLPAWLGCGEYIDGWGFGVPPPPARPPANRFPLTSRFLSSKLTGDSVVMVVKHTLTTVLSTKFDIDPARPPSSDGTSRFQDIGTALAALLPLLEVEYGLTDAGCMPLSAYVGNGSAAHPAESTA